MWEIKSLEHGFSRRTAFAVPAVIEWMTTSPSNGDPHVGLFHRLFANVECLENASRRKHSPFDQPARRGCLLHFLIEGNAGASCVGQL